MKILLIKGFREGIYGENNELVGYFEVGKGIHRLKGDKVERFYCTHQLDCSSYPQGCLLATNNKSPCAHARFKPIQ